MAEMTQPDRGLEPRQDLAQESLVGAVQSSFNVLRIIMIVLLFAYLASGIFQVDPDEQGLIIRFGRFRATTDGSEVFREGWHVAWPDPIEEKLRLSGKEQTVTIDDFLFTIGANDRGKALSEIDAPRRALTPGSDGAMLAGDNSLAHGRWYVRFEVVDAQQFVENIGDRLEDATSVISSLARTAIVREVAYRQFDAIVGEGRTELSRDVQRRVQAELDALESGIDIKGVSVDTKVPGRVNPSFLAVSQASNDAKRQEEEAIKNAGDTLNKAAGEVYPALLAAIEAYGDEEDQPQPDSQRLAELRDAIYAGLDGAGGEVAKQLGAAEAAASLTQEQIKSEADEFRYYHERYTRNPELTRVRRWVEMRQAVLTSFENEVFYLPPFGAIEILTNRDAQKQIERERRQYEKRFQ